MTDANNNAPISHSIDPLKYHATNPAMVPATAGAIYSGAALLYMGGKNLPPMEVLASNAAGCCASEM